MTNQTTDLPKVGQTTRPTLSISVHRTNAERALQLNLSQTDPDGSGFGYRLAGPKHYNMGTEELLSADLDERDAAEIRRMLNAAFPADVTVSELRAGTDAEPDHVARYATEQAAAAHGEALYRTHLGTAANLEWRPTGTDAAPRYRLIAVDDLDGDEVETDWHIVAATVPATYTPAGGEQA